MNLFFKNQANLLVLTLLVFQLVLFLKCRSEILTSEIFGKDIESIRIKPEWFIKNMNLIIYKKNPKNSSDRFVAVLYRAGYSKSQNKIYIVFHPIWTKKNQVGFLQNIPMKKFFDRVDTFCVSFQLGEDKKIEFDFFLLPSKKNQAIEKFSKNKFPLFLKDKFLGNSVPLTFHLTVDPDERTYQPGIRSGITQNLFKIVTNPVSEGKIVRGLSEFTNQEEDRSFYLGFFTQDVWEEYFMDYRFRSVFFFEKFEPSSSLWPL